MSKKPLIVTINVSIGPESPCDSDGWKLHSFARNKFVTDVNPDEYVKEYDRKTGEVKAANGQLTRKLGNGLAFWLSYYEHGDGAWSIKGTGQQCRFDTAQLAGILVWESKAKDLGPKTVEDRAADARKFLERYNEWANGYVYDWEVREPGEDEPVDDGSGHEWVGSDDMMAEILRLVGDRPVIARGDCSWMLSGGLYTNGKKLEIVDEDEVVEDAFSE